MDYNNPVIIIGAGIVGLTLAHGLNNSWAGIPFEIYERDESIDSRGQGWAITLHWALPFLRAILAPDVFQSLDRVQVDPAIGRNDTGNSLFLNLATLEAKFRIPPNERRLVNCEKMRRLLLEGLLQDGKVQVLFEGVSSKTISLGVGAEDSNSCTRKFLKPQKYRNHQLPVRFVGVAVDMTDEEVLQLGQVDPLLFQGSHPESEIFMWVSMLDVPETNGTAGTSNKHCRVQINLSWPVKIPDDEVLSTDVDRLAQMKSNVGGFAPLLSDAVSSIPDSTPILPRPRSCWVAKFV